MQHEVILLREAAARRHNRVDAGSPMAHLSLARTGVADRAGGKETMTMRCGRCGHEILDTDKSCAECGMLPRDAFERAGQFGRAAVS